MIPTPYTAGPAERVTLGPEAIPALRITPQGAPTGEPLPALVFQHGYGADKYDLQMAAEVVAGLGYITILPDAWGHGERFDPTGPNWMTGSSADYFIDVVRHVVADLGTIVTALAADPQIDAQRIILSGFSLGGICSILAAQRDPRVAAVAAIAGGVSPDILEAPLGMGDISPAQVAWVEENDMGQPENAARLAPRPVFLLHGRNDDRLPARGSERLYRAAKPAYTSAPDQLRLRLYDATHEITMPMLTDALEWLVTLGS